MKSIYFTAFNQLFMNKIFFSFLCLLQAIVLSAQKTEQGFDFFFKPTEYAPRYYVITEKKDTLWHRQAYYLPERGMAMEGWYKDEDCKIAHGIVLWYHPNRILKSRGAYVNGEKEGIWLEYDEEGRMNDSSNYVAGRLEGVRMRWHSNGMPSDSVQFDGAGNGVEVRWYEDGHVSSAGYWVSDTLKKGRWKYYHRNGNVMATEDYVNGERTACHCYDETGKELDATTCEEKEAEFPGANFAWIQFIQRTLKPEVPVRNRAPLGQYTVIVQFVVDTDGKVTQIKSLTRFGYGMEEEAERMLKQSPRWIPAQQFGRKVKAYRRQPITFVVQNG